MTEPLTTEAARLAELVKLRAEDMADAACGAEAGDFVKRQRTPLHAAIDALAALATSPPAGAGEVRKPLSPEEILKECPKEKYGIDGWSNFQAGVWFAERHHGIPARSQQENGQ